MMASVYSLLTSAQWEERNKLTDKAIKAHKDNNFGYRNYILDARNRMLVTVKENYIYPRR